MSLKQLFKDIADSLRQKTGTTEPIKASNFPTEIASLKLGGIKKYTSREGLSSAEGEDGDLAVVYGKGYKGIDANTEFQYVFFPKTVVLKAQLSTNLNGIGFVRLDGMGGGGFSLNSTSMVFGWSSASGGGEVKYTSADGITYTRIDNLPEVVDLLAIWKHLDGQPWDNTISKFMQIEVDSFGGIYKYENGTWNLMSPKDTLEITENGIYDVSNYAEANVNLDMEITDASYLFYNGARLDNMEKILTLCRNLTQTISMFQGCNALTTIPEFKTNNVNMMRYMFSECTNVITIPELNADKCNTVYSMFVSCNALENFGGLQNLGKAYTAKTVNNNVYKLDLQNSKKLTYNSIMNVINNLYDLNLTYNVANSGKLYTQSLILGATNLAKLTDEEKAIATAKGWTLS